jgi:hypothetical protein
MAVCALIATGLIPARAASKAVIGPNQPYVTCLGGVFYARAIPDEEKGSKGTTTIYRVRRDQDEVVDRHAWYASGGLHLGWSPIAGKISAMALSRDTAKDPAEQVEFSFYIGTQHLTTYTTADLAKMGGLIHPTGDTDRRGAAFRVTGCEQIPGTNEYVYRVVLETSAGEKTVDFDVLTGRPYDAKLAATRPAHD